MARYNSRAWLINEVAKQQKWIDECERNGRSYADPTWGPRVRQADIEELTRLERKLKGAG